MNNYSPFESVYFSTEYISLYMSDGDEIFQFNYSDGNNSFICKSIKRPITKIGAIELNDIYFDLHSAYGYGGVICNTSNQIFLEKAKIAYNDYCLENKIIAEFSRIHPENIILNDYYDFNSKDRKLVFVELNNTIEERWSNYSSKTRNILRKANKNLIIRETNDIHNFYSLYISTMVKNNASDFYYFSKEYFNKLIKINGVRLYEVLFNDTVVSASFFLVDKNICHYHLSANNYQFKNLNANYFLLDSVFEIMNQMNLNYINLGGGRTDFSDDLLFKFKKKFSSKFIDSHIVGKIFNKKLYDQYTSIYDNQSFGSNDKKYFLKYRLN